MTVSPEVGIGIEDATVVPVAPSPQVAGTHVAGIRRSTPVALPAKAASGAAADAPRLAIGQNRPVHQAELISLPAPTPDSPLPVPSQPEPVAAPVEPLPVAAPPTAPPAASPPRFVASFESGLRVWNTAAGDLAPLVVTVPADEGATHAFAFSFYIETIAYGTPGVDNLILQLGGDAAKGRSLGLQLWDDWQSGQRGLWSSGEAVGEERFLAPVPERVWHDVVVHFEASSQGGGFYEVYLDDGLIDAGSGVSLIAPGSSYAQIEVGLLRDDELVPGASEIWVDAVKLGETLESVLP